MFSHNKPQPHKTFVDSETSSESEEVNDIVEGDQVISTEQTPDRESKHFALKKVYGHNVKDTPTRIKDCDLEEFRRRYQIPNSIKMFVPNLGETADNAPKDCVAVYKSMLENGLRLPANDFVNEILATVGRAPAQVTPNSWVILTAFQVACHVAGVKPLIELFKTMYKITNLTRDYIYFSQRENKNLTLLNFPKKNKHWGCFFFVSANAFAKEVPKAFSGNTATFKCGRPDIEMQYREFERKFPQRLLCDAYLDEKVMQICNIYKGGIKMPKEDAYALLLKANDALVKTAIAKNDQLVLKYIKEENLRSGKSAIVDVSDVSVAFRPSEPDCRVAPVILSSVPPLSTVSAAPETTKSSILYQDEGHADEIIDLDEFWSSMGKPLSNTSSSHLASAWRPWPKTFEGKRQVDRINETIAPHSKKKRTSPEILLDEINDDVADTKHMETDTMPIKEPKREFVTEAAPRISGLKDQDELDLISDQLDAILKKGVQSHQETSDHTIQMSTILASLEYFHLGASLENAAQEVSNLRDQVVLLHSCHAKLVMCQKNYDQQVSNCKNNVAVLNSVRARLESFGLKESREEVSRLEGQVVKLNSIHAQLVASVERCAQLKASLEKSEQEVSILEDEVSFLKDLHKSFSLQNSHSTQNDSLITKVQFSLKEFEQLEGSIKKSAEDVGDLIYQVRQLTAILVEVVDVVEQANNDFKTSSASTKILYAKLGEKA